MPDHANNPSPIPAICSSCGLLLSPGMIELIAAGPVSHGFCKACAKEMWEEYVRERDSRRKHEDQNQSDVRSSMP
jgi:hypothetical protein